MLNYIYKKAIDDRSKKFISNKINPEKDFSLFLNKNPIRTKIAHRLFDTFPLNDRQSKNGLKLTFNLALSSYVQQAMTTKINKIKKQKVSKEMINKILGEKTFDISSPIDNILLNDKKLSSINGLTKWFQRSFAVFLLSKKSNNNYVCNLKFLDQYQYNSNEDLKLGCLIEFYSDVFSICKIEANGLTFNFDRNGKQTNNGNKKDLELACRTVLSATMQYCTIVHHATINHMHVSDNILFSFANNIFKNDKKHILIPLLATVANGTVEVNDSASVSLVNLGKSLASDITSFNQVDVQSMTNKTQIDYRDLVFYPQIEQNILDFKDLPVIKSLKKWWEIINPFIESYIGLYYKTDKDILNDQNLCNWLRDQNESENLNGLVKICSMLYYNNVVHTLFSNQTFIKILHDPEKLITTPPTNIYENNLVDLSKQLRAILTFLTTAGKTFQWIDNPIHESITISVDKEVESCFKNFHANVNKLMNEWEEDDDLIDTIHPKNIACSVAW